MMYQRQEQQNQEKSKLRKPEYSKDKYIWLKLDTGIKIKLRKYLSEVAKELSKANKVSYEINREFIIKAYNNGGLSAVKAWIDNEFELIKNKENEKT